MGGFKGFGSALLHNLIQSKSSYVTNYLIKHYPRVYKFLVGQIASGVCPFCGRKINARYVFKVHIRSSKCSNNWYKLISFMYGEDRLTEEELIEFLNDIRRKHGLEDCC